MANAPTLPPEYRGREQSFVKHLVLRSYLERVAMIILSRWPDFVFVDGYSGPWQNAREDLSDTSFGISLAQLQRAKANWAAHDGREKKVRCVFVEKRKAAFQKLEAASQAIDDVPIKPLHGQLEDHIPAILDEVGRSFAMFFLDPTGWNYDLQNLRPLLQHSPGEVLVNFMYEHFRRWIDDKRPEIRRSQDRALGGPEWRHQYKELLTRGVEKETAVLEVFKAQLKRVGGYKHVASARIRNPLAARTHFHLVYGTRHERGLTEFRNVEKKVMVAEEGIRLQTRDAATEARTGQATFHDMLGASPDDPRLEDHAKVSEWVARAVTPAGLRYERMAWAAMERYSITEPEFKDLLVVARDAGHIEFSNMPAKARKPRRDVIITEKKM